MDNIKVVYLDMPTSIKSYVILKNDFYTIVLNSKLSNEQNRLSYEHEIKHIVNGDYNKKCHSDIIEIVGHKKQ